MSGIDFGFIDFGSQSRWFLLLLLLLPVLWRLSYDSLAGLGKWRRVLALVLRTVVFTTLVLALAQTQWRKTTDRLTVMYLLDQSDSIPAAKREFMSTYVFEAVRAHRRSEKRDMAGVIVFGGSAKIESAPYDGELPSIGRIESNLNSESTSLESALKLAKASFPEDTAKRIVIVSDGNENLGDALSMAQSLSEDGTGIDIVPVDLFQTNEVSVDKVVLPSEIRKGQDFEAKVVLSNDLAAGTPEGQGAVKGRLRLTQKTAQREVLVEEKPITLEPGKNVYSFSHKVDRSDVFTFSATFVPDEEYADSDMLSQNNKASAFSHVRGKGRVLLIEDGNDRGEFIHLIERLRMNSIEIDVMPSTQLFTDGAELLQYDSIILANVPRATGDSADDVESFSDQQIRALVRNCEKLGCGLVMLGGDRSFGAGGWANTELEKAMPIDFQIKNDKIDAVGALVLMMHACEIPEGNFWQTKIAQVSIEVLGPMDYCGVIEWSNYGGAPRWLWKLPNGIDRIYKNRNTMKGMVGRMVNGDMPDFNAPMRLTLNQLKRTKASMKHMIIISDGDPSKPTPSLLNQFVKNKIKVSTVAVGSHGILGSRVLQNIANVTGGQYYVAKDPRALPKIYQREARRVAKPVIKESQSGMQAIPGPMASSHDILDGINLDEIPLFYGFVMSTIKKNELLRVNQLLRSNDPADNRENSTLLATWQYGAGTATVFTADAGNVWTAEWYDTPMYDKFFTQLIRHSMRPITENANFTVGTEIKDNKASVVITALKANEDFLNFLQISAQGINPDQSSFGLDFRQVAPGRYVAEFDVSKSGNYLFSIFPGEGYERLTSGINIPYSTEYSDREANAGLLDSMSNLTPFDGEKGVLIKGELNQTGLSDLLSVNTFRPTLTNAVSIQDIWPWLVVLCSGLFFADVFVRRVAVRFDWIGKYVSDFRNRSVNNDVQTSMARLQSRKAKIEQEIETRRAATRFTPQVDDKVSGRQKLEQVIGDEITEAADRRRPVKRDKSLDVGADEKSYTSRLLDAKRNAQKSQKRNSSPGEPDE